jgi:hypothetical protein
MLGKVISGKVCLCRFSSDLFGLGHIMSGYDLIIQVRTSLARILQVMPG